MNPANLRKLEKRKILNRENLVRSFTGHSGVNPYTGIYAQYNPVKFLDLLPADELLKFMRLYVNNRSAVDHILTYARRFKQAVMELEIDDIEARTSFRSLARVVQVYSHFIPPSQILQQVIVWPFTGRKRPLSC